MKKFLLIIILIVLLSNIIHAADTAVTNPNDGSTIRIPTVKPTENTLPKGENGTLALTFFTKSYVKIFEGSKLDFNLYGKGPDDLLAENSLIIQKINKASIDYLFSQDNSAYQKITYYPLKQSNQIQLNFTGLIPFMFLEFSKWRFIDENNPDNSVTLFFNVPIPGASSLSQTQSDTQTVVDLSKVSSGNVEKSNTWMYYLAGALALILALVLIFKPSKHKEIKKD